jgi:hypothetical protein
MMIKRRGTMFSFVIIPARQAIVTMGFIAIFLGNAAGASPNTITVQDPRPVAKAIEELENRYGWQITYEDPPYIHNSDITDVTDTPWPGATIQSLSQLQSLQREPAAHHRTLVPKGGSLSFTLPSANPVEFGAVEALVKSYNASRGGNVFAVVHGVGLLHVVPRNVTGLFGYLEPVKPVLDTVITVEQKERTALALLEEVCRKISIGTNTNVFVGESPINMLIQMKTSIGGSRKTARSILDQLILESGAPLSWQLFYGPDNPEGYALNINLVASVK